jgi:hypothetical protein
MWYSNQVNNFLSLRVKLIITILPLFILILILNSYFSILESRSALTRLASKHLAYKAEQLRDYAFSEWTTLQSLGLDDNPEYLDAMEKSIHSFARSLLRNQSETIFNIDPGAELFSRIGLGATDEEEPLTNRLAAL